MLKNDLQILKDLIPEGGGRTVETTYEGMPTKMFGNGYIFYTINTIFTFDGILKILDVFNNKTIEDNSKQDKFNKNTIELHLQAVVDLVTEKGIEYTPEFFDRYENDCITPDKETYGISIKLFKRILKLFKDYHNIRFVIHGKDILVLGEDNDMNEVLLSYIAGVSMPRQESLFNN